MAVVHTVPALFSAIFPDQQRDIGSLENPASVDDAKQAWLEERAKGIGASEVGTILGLNPYDSAYSLWLRKTGQIPAQEETLAMWLGHEMEPVIAKRYEMETGRTLVDPGDFTIKAHPEYPWLRATLDRETTFEDGVKGPVEFKAPMAGYLDEDGLWHAPHSHKETWLKDSAPLTAQAQIQIQMACGGYERGEIVALLGNSDFLILPYERNDEFLDAIIPVLHEFWECVQNRIAPEVDGSEATVAALAKLHPLDNGETVDLPPDLATDIEAWQELQAEVKALEQEITLRKNRIKVALGPNTFGVVGNIKVSHKAQTRAPYTVETSSTFRVLRKVGK